MTAPSARPTVAARRAVAIVVLVCGVLLGGAAARGAAASGVVAASPQPGAVVVTLPSQVRIRFVAPVEGRLAVLEYWQDRRIVSGPVRVDANDPQLIAAPIPHLGVQVGTGWVRYRVLTGDGHVFAGVYPVQIAPVRAAAKPAGAPAGLGSGVGAWITGVGRGLVLAGLVLALGLTVLRWGVAGPAWKTGGVVPPGRLDDSAPFRSRTAQSLVVGGRAWWGALWTAVAVWGVGIVCVTLGLLVWIGAGVASAGPLLSGTRTGHAMIMLAALCALSVVATALLGRAAHANDPSPPVGWGIALGAPAGLGILVMSWQGHASDGTDASINIPADAIHTIATAGWIGGLVGLLVLVVSPAQRLAAGDRVRLLAGAVVRFSTLAIVSVTLLVVTGTYRALAALGSLTQLVDTSYGLALVAKLAIFAVMLIAGGYSRIVLHPRLERAALGLDPDDRGASRALRTSLRIELALAAALMIAVAVLLALTPPG